VVKKYEITVKDLHVISASQSYNVPPQAIIDISDMILTNKDLVLAYGLSLKTIRLIRSAVLAYIEKKNKDEYNLLTAKAVINAEKKQKDFEIGKLAAIQRESLRSLNKAKNSKMSRAQKQESAKKLKSLAKKAELKAAALKFKEGRAAALQRQRELKEANKLRVALKNHVALKKKEVKEKAEKKALALATFEAGKALVLAKEFLNREDKKLIRKTELARIKTENKRLHNEAVLARKAFILMYKEAMVANIVFDYTR
jgi:hypothetical protein